MSKSIKEHICILRILQIHQFWLLEPCEDLHRLHFKQKISLLSDLQPKITQSSFN